MELVNIKIWFTYRPIEGVETNYAKGLAELPIMHAFQAHVKNNTKISRDLTTDF
jgi:hypothetical protein